MPHQQSTSSKSSSKRPSSRPRGHPPAQRSTKKLAFGDVEVISDASTPKSSSTRTTNSSGSRKIGGKLRRSPTPVLTSLNELTDAHLTQLSTVWQWKAEDLPAFESDKRSIAATRAENKPKPDPFDF